MGKWEPNMWLVLLQCWRSLGWLHGALWTGVWDAGGKTKPLALFPPTTSLLPWKHGAARGDRTGPEPLTFLSSSLSVFSLTWQYMNHELPDVQAGFRKGRETRDKIANICWITKKAREFQKKFYFCFIDYAKAFHCVDHKKLWKILKEMGLPDHLTYPWEICMQVKKQQLELDVEQWTGSKLNKAYLKAVNCHPAYLTYMQSTSWEMLGWMNHKLESSLPGEISITSDMQMTPALWQKVKKN